MKNNHCALLVEYGRQELGDVPPRIRLSLVKANLGVQTERAWAAVNKAYGKLDQIELTRSELNRLV